MFVWQWRPSNRTHHFSMNFNEEEEQQLEYWVTTQLQSIKQRNPEVLAKLIVSLVKEDKSFDELKAYCITELKAFLKSQTEDFVCVLLEALTGDNNTANFSAKQKVTFSVCALQFRWKL